MVENSRVKLKLFLLLLAVPSISSLPLQTDPVAQAQGLVPVPQAVVDERASTENNEVSWLNAIVARTNATTDANGNIISTNDRAPLGLDLVPTTTPEATTLPAELPSETLECKHYSEEACRNRSECDITVETCQTKDHLRHLACHVIFSYPLDLITNSTEKYLPVEKMKVKQMGCMEYQAAHLSDCTNIEKCLQQRLNMHSIGMCCCTTPHCNQEGNLWMLNPDLMRDVEEMKHFFVPTEPPETSPFENLVSSTGLLWMVFVIFVLILIIIACLAWRLPRFYRSMKKEKVDTKKKNGNVVDFYGAKVIEEGHLPLVTHEEVEMQPTPKELPLSDWQPLVLGRMAQVYKAKWTSDKGDEKWVAVKKMAESLHQSYAAEKEVFEALASHSKWYSSIVQFVCAEKIGQEYWVVTEFCERLSLYDLLKHNVISIDSCNRIILSMTDGLAFLHETKPYYISDYEKKAIIHRDLKSKNIFVKSDMTACIADFGLARQFKGDCETSDLLGQVGTKRYMAPEMLDGAADYTVQAFKAMDVYSMGLVMWEVISRTKLSPTDEVPDYKAPYDWLGTDPVLCDLRKTVTMMKIRPKWRPEVLTHGFMKDLVKVVVDMWETEGSSRTTSGFVFQKVWRLVNAVEVDRSEGYHSGGSVEDEDFKASGSTDCDRRMKVYHNCDGSMPHPSPDPIHNHCPPLPMIPVLTEDGIIHAADAEPSQKSIHEEDPEVKPVILTDSSAATSKPKRPDTYYSVELQRLLTAEEAKPLFEADEKAEESRKKRQRRHLAILDGRVPDKEDESDEEEEKRSPSVSVSRRSSVTPAGDF